MVKIIFYSILTCNNNLNDEEMMTSHLMCVMTQLFYDKNMFERKKQQKKPWQSMLHNKTIPS